MGNCLHRQSSTQWAGDDWGTSTADDDDGTRTEEKGLVRNRHKHGSITPSSAATPSSTHAVKVKITKKQLEELLGMVDVNELSVQEVLAQLINVSSNQSDIHFQPNQRSWRPKLQSIPELN
ncbi:hypothetical protein V6N11_004841 [Hibiscus sabdariffa]|uniref:Uncharacterized protein n=1 Tax=Hibiscus sabdariffa TaxID=183260 RepID=A0ABR2SI73_9ROSI